MRATLADGWIELDSCKSYIGQGATLYRTPGGNWLLFTDKGYQRLSLEDAHRWLEEHGHYPKNLGCETSAAL